MSQIDRIYNQLARNTEYPGISTKVLAHRTRLTRNAVSKRIADLREEGEKIFTNTRKVAGELRYFYRLAA